MGVFRIYSSYFKCWKRLNEPGAALTKFTLCSGGSSRDCWGAASHTASPTARAEPGRLDGPASRRGHEYSQTCAYKEGIKICTAASFQCVWKLPKVTNLKCAKNSFVKKSGKKKKSLPWQQCIRNPSEISRHVCSTPTPNRWRTKLSVRAEGSAVFYGKSQAQADASQSLCIYM